MLPTSGRLQTYTSQQGGGVSALIFYVLFILQSMDTDVIPHEVVLDFIIVLSLMLSLKLYLMLSMMLYFMLFLMLS